MRSFRVALALWLAIPAYGHTTSEAQETLLLRTVRFYNSFRSAGHLVNLMKATASAEDRKFLESLSADTLKKSPPEAAAHGRELYFRGLPKPILILDLSAGKYAVEGRPFTFNYRGELQKSLSEMERAIYPAKTSALEWVLPSAHAINSQQKDNLVMMSGVMGIASLLQCFMQMSQNGGQMPAPPPQPAAQYVQLPNGQVQQVQQPQQMSSCGNALFGLLAMMMAMSIDPDNKPQEIKCTVDMTGARTLVVNGLGGAPLTAPIVQQPGKPIIFPPTMTGSQITAASHLNQFCMNPMALQAANQALQAPYTIPSTPIYSPPPSGKPQVVTTQSTEPRQPAMTEPEHGTADFMKTGAAGSR